MGTWDILWVLLLSPFLIAWYLSFFFFKKKDGPILTQTDLYLLKPELEIHSILQEKHPTLHLSLNMSTGMHHHSKSSTSLHLSYDQRERERWSNREERNWLLTHSFVLFCFSFWKGQWQDDTGNEFKEKGEPAVLPRVNQLYIISEFSPWCTTVKNEQGVTLGDVCTTIWREYVVIVFLIPFLDRNAKKDMI